MAVACAAGAILIRAVLDPVLGDDLALVTLFAGVAASVWFGGVGPGALTAILGFAAADYLFMDPRGAFGFRSATHVVGFLAYAGSCALFLAFGHAMRATRSRARARLDLLQTTLASIGDAVITTDADGRVTFLNGHAEELTGWGTADARGKPLSEVFVIVSEITGDPALDPAARALSEGKVVGLANHTILISRDGARRPIDDSAAPIRDDEGQVAGCILVFRDVSERREAERALREADRRKDEFLATLAHELRNPLSPIRNALGLMELAPEDGAIGAKARATMERQVRQLERLIDDLLDISRITRNRLDLKRESVSLTGIIEQVVDSQRASAVAGGLQLSLQHPAEEVRIEADPVRLSQIIGNLLNNAIKYTQQGGRVEVTLRRDSGNAIVSVRDDGAGIPPDMLDSVFDMFVQVDRRLERSVGGLGIGLTLVRQLVELHGGTVRAASDGPGRGSEFTVSLPLTDAVTRAQLQPVRERPMTVPRRILVVDDNRDGAQSLAMLLELSGHETRLAFDGEEAMTAAADYRPEVILLDIGLPNVNGFDVCRRLRAEPWGKELTIIALTGWGQDSDRQNSREAGFDGHLVKPVNHEKLLGAVADGGRSSGADGRH